MKSVCYHWAAIRAVHRRPGVRSIAAVWPVPGASLVRKAHPIAVSIRTWATWSSGTLESVMLRVGQTRTELTQNNQ